MESQSTEWNTNVFIGDNDRRAKRGAPSGRKFEIHEAGTPKTSAPSGVELCLTDRSDLYEMRHEWEELITRDSHATVFQKWEFIYHASSIDRESVDAHLLCFRDQRNRLVGLAPLGIRNKVLLPGTRIRILQFLAEDYCDYAHILADDFHRDEVVRRSWAWIARQADAVNLVDIGSIPEESPILSNESPAGEAFVRDHVSVHSVAPFVELDPKWTHYDDALSSSRGQTVRRYKRKLFREFDCTFRKFDGGRVAEAFDRLTRVHQQRMEQKTQAGLFADPSTTQAFRELVVHLGKDGTALIYELRTAEKIIASLLAFRFRDRTLYYQGGFNPEFDSYSPGWVMLGLCIDDAIKSGQSEFDLGEGDEKYKFSWATGTRKLVRIERKQDSLLGRLYTWLDTARRSASQYETLRHVFLSSKSLLP